MEDALTAALDLRSSPAGVLLPLQAQAGARQNAITGVHDGRLKVAVTQVAERGKANREILRLLADALQLRKSQLELQSGTTSAEKLLLVRGLTVEDLHRRISDCLK